MLKTHLKPLTFQRYGNRFWKRFTSFDHTRYVTECSIVEAEAFPVAAAFPLVFRKTEGGVEPVALFSLTEARVNPFVSETGVWLAPYLPSAMRCPPFDAEPIPRSGRAKDTQFQLLVDETLGLISDDPRDEAFYRETGALSSNLEAVVTFFQGRMSSAQTTKTICDVLADMEMLEPLTQHEGCMIPTGCWGISPDRLNSLTSKQMATLTACGALRLVHAHQISLSHIAWLTQAQSRMTHNPGSKDVERKANAEGFLSALADAQTSETSWGQNSEKHACAR
ncbi:SapC family protein [Ruegeria sp. R13_0]|uniref:SapC family protein n=1 Tax=Ruegeria sp. R13_0 TaxID=2821099 RepID=UPI001ADC6502|nr:SapC family protein [Ruegeria sp. R13_0]MBO9435052.1 SapC family protein [Ruegeria sp. R13_0]